MASDPFKGIPVKVLRAIGEEMDLDMGGRRANMIEELEGSSDWPEIERKLINVREIVEEEKEAAKGISAFGVPQAIEIGSNLMYHSTETGEERVGAAMWSGLGQIIVEEDTGGLILFQKEGGEWVCADVWRIGKAPAPAPIALGALRSYRGEAWSSAPLRLDREEL